MQKLLLYDIPIKSYNMLNIDMFDSVQNNFAEIWALKEIYVQPYGKIKKQNVP